MSVPVVVAVAADLHAGSTVALCPERVDLDDAGVYLASKAQRWLLRCWHDAWQHVAGIVEERGARLYAVINGDLTEGIHHGGEQLVTSNTTYQQNIAIQILEPVARAADRLFIVRGSSAHAGGAGRLEEKVAQDLGAVKDDVLGTHSWWHLPLIAQGVRIDIQHHPVTSGRRPWTEQAAAAREASIIASRYTASDSKVPAVAIRSHVHYFADSGIGCRPRTFFTRPWKLTDAYGHRLGTGRSVVPPGLLVLVCHNGQVVAVEDKRYKPRERRAWAEKQ